MDRTAAYIKQCDCPEIQERWNPGLGDYYFVRARTEPTSIVDVYSGHRWALLPREVNYGWLPTQSQIQTLLQPIELHELLDICAEPDGIMWRALHQYAESMEQLWLAFYMYEKHGKVWDDKQWVKK